MLEMSEKSCRSEAEEVSERKKAVARRELDERKGRTNQILLCELADILPHESQKLLYILTS